jgi:hypothetical protein
MILMETSSLRGKIIVMKKMKNGNKKMVLARERELRILINDVPV